MVAVMQKQQAGQVRARLAAWWEANARDLPWRFGRATPWGVLVSEVMSQQTQMSRVVPYWTDWMKRWPDAAALADASTAEVITAWGRLGYPRRALRLQECAHVVAHDLGDELPRTYDELVALPGVGDYTASAVMSFAFGERIAVVDTNIRRVLSRVFLGVESRGGSASAAERALACDVLPEDDVPENGVPDSGILSDDVVPENVVPENVVADSGESGNDVPDNAVPDDVPENAASDSSMSKSATSRYATPRAEADARHVSREPRSTVWNQSVMELGALVCTAKTPLCDACPVRAHCRFLAAGRPGLGERRTRPRQRFAGTDRQVRGLILDSLRKAPAGAAMPRDRIAALWSDHIQLDKCVASLDDDGLIELQPDGSVRLP